jgi:hypothetical protein
VDPLSLIGILVTVVIALWQYRKARRAEARLERFLEDLPSQLVANVVRFLEQKEQTATEITTADHQVTSRYVDINGDGREELLVVFPIGPHGSVLQVYGMDGSEFKLIAETSTEVPSGFDLEDVDRDGTPELRVAEVNYSSGMPYVMGLRDVVWYRLESGKFVEVKRETPSDAEIEEVSRELEEMRAKKGIPSQ